jgi:hypothetical protein
MTPSQNTATKPLPVITVDPAGPDSRPPRPLAGHPVAVAVAGVLAATGIALILINWHAVVTALVTLFVILLLVLVAACLLFRIATGGRLGSAIVGALVAAVLMRRRR